jgi:hypothetical protein
VALARELCVHPEALRRLGVGINGEGWSTWPERDASGQIIGVLRRPRDNGKKLCVKGSRRGLTLPDGGIVPGAPDDGPLFVAEGASDVAALLSMGQRAIGRSSAKHGNRLLVELLRGCQGAVVVLADNDPSGAGQEGAESAARDLVAAGVAATWAPTPDGAKDPRAWLRNHVSGGLDLDNDQACIETGQMFLAKLVRNEPTKIASGRPTFELLHFRPFPMDLFSPVLADIVREGAEVHQVDESMIALPVLATVGAAIGAARCVACGGQRRMPVVWGAVVVHSGSNKTEAMQEGTRPILQAEKDAAKDHKDLYAKYEIAKKEYDAKPAAEKLEANKPTAPTPRRFRTADFTVEAVHSLLDRNRRGLLIARNELTAFFDFGRYSRTGRGTGESATILEWFDGRSTVVDRKSPESPAIMISHTCVSIIGTITPGAFSKALTDERYDQGLAARFLVSSPPYKRKRYVPREPDPSVRARYEELVRQILDLEVQWDGDQIDPTPLYLSQDAGAAYEAFFEQLEDRLEAANEAGDGNGAAMLSKLGAYCPRLALILQLAHDPHSTIVEGWAMENAIGLVWWFEHEGRRVHQGLRMSDEDRIVARTIEAVRKHGDGGRIAPHKLASSCRWVNGVEHARVLLDDLVQRGHGRLVHVQNPKGGPSATVFELSCHGNPG